MGQWDKINWPALNRRAHEIEADLWRWSVGQPSFNEKDVVAPITQADYATLYALMVWSDDGGPEV